MGLLDGGPAKNLKECETGEAEQKALTLMSMLFMVVLRKDNAADSTHVEGGRSGLSLVMWR